MCRFVAYHGPPVDLHELLYRPEHSLVNQSYHAEERKEPLNGDGWGVGWYEPDVAAEPAVYRTVNPAWSDENMRHVSPLVRTPVFLAHVRAATKGLAVQQLNCHPFQGGEHVHGDGHEGDELRTARHRLLFMHNGHVGGYRRVIRRLRRELPDDLYFGIRGSTDSEHAFAVVQEKLGEKVLDPSPRDLADAVAASIRHLEDLKRQEGAGDDDTALNLVLTDGRTVVATRFASPEGKAAQTLHLGQARGFYTVDGRVRARGPDEEGATLIASEPLFEDERVWRTVPRNHLVLVTPDGEVTVEALDVAG